jgi:hypothetical protein
MSSFSVKKFEPVIIRGYWALGGVEGAPEALARIDEVMEDSQSPSYGVFWDPAVTRGPHKGKYFAGAPELSGRQSSEVRRINVPGGQYAYSTIRSYKSARPEELSDKIKDQAMGMAAFVLNFYPRDRNRPEFEKYDPVADIITLGFPILVAPEFR